jgi:hypothetical protein
MLRLAGYGIISKVFCPGTPLPFPYKLMGVTILSSDQGGQMQNSKDIQRDSSAGLLDTFGGEPLSGSGFEAEDPDEGFSVTEEAVQE